MSHIGGLQCRQLLTGNVVVWTARNLTPFCAPLQAEDLPSGNLKIEALFGRALFTRTFAVR